MKTILPIFLLSSAPLLSAQYAEPSATVLYEKTIGAASNLFGWAAVPLGDVNGDGVEDLAVAAPFSSGGGRSSAGRVYALSGADGSTLWSRNETRQSAILGYSLETMDWNADGTLDVVAGAPFATVGRIWIFDGTSGATLAELLGPATSSGFGASVATGGDFDGDGLDDLLVAAPFVATAAGTEVGRVYVFSRGSTSAFTSLDGPYAGAQFGLGLAFVGDTTLPADGRDELVAGYRDAASFFDGFARVFAWNGTSAQQRFTVSGVGMGFDLLGDRIEGGGDVNGDGAPDFLVGDLFHSEVELFSGTNGALLRTLDGNGEGGDFGAAHFLHDVDRDGRADLVVGAWQNASGADDGGKVFVYSGASGTLLKTITSTHAGQNLGIDAREFGDFNADGRRDLLVGAYGDGFGGPQPGAALVFSGHLPAPVNVLLAAERASDPALSDVGGDPGAGPLVGSALEPFNLALDCRNASAPGPYVIQVRTQPLATPLVTSFGNLWIDGAVLFTCAGTHAQDVVRCSPNGIVLPNQAGLIGRVFAAQGGCDRRLSNALRQTIGG
jgi:hypothetical protein